MNKEIETRFKYHTPSPDDARVYAHIRREVKELAYTLDAVCPEGREKARALTALEDVMFNANASIARRGLPAGAVRVAIAGESAPPPSRGTEDAIVTSIGGVRAAVRALTSERVGDPKGPCFDCGAGEGEIHPDDCRVITAHRALLALEQAVIVHFRGGVK